MQATSTVSRVERRCCCCVSMSGAGAGLGHDEQLTSPLCSVSGKYTDTDYTRIFCGSGSVIENIFRGFC